MSDQFLGEIRMFGFNYAPYQWAQCNGALLPIAQNSALFSLLGVSFGGNGTSNFALPNLQGAIPIAAGQGPGLTERVVGEEGGSATVTLIASEMPSHSHTVSASTIPLGTVAAPGPTVGLSRPASGLAYGTSGTPTTLAPFALTPTGGNASHNNLQPYGVVNYCIALAGNFPQRP